MCTPFYIFLQINITQILTCINHYYLA